MLTAYKAATDHQRLLATPFNVGTSMWLDARNIQTTQPAKKLDHKRLSPFTVTKVVSTHARQLGLPHNLRSIHNIFHVSILEPAVTDCKGFGQIWLYSLFLHFLLLFYFCEFQYSAHISLTTCPYAVILVQPQSSILSAHFIFFSVM